MQLAPASLRAALLLLVAFLAPRRAEAVRATEFPGTVVQPWPAENGVVVSTPAGGHGHHRSASSSTPHSRLQVLSSTSSSKGVAETVDAAARSSAATARRFQEAVEALRDAEAKVIGAQSQAGEVRARRTQPKAAAAGGAARQPDLTAASLAMSGEWQQSAASAAFNSSERAPRSRHIGASGQGDPFQDRASLALLLGAMATLLVGGLLVICLVHSWARSPRLPGRERLRDHPGSGAEAAARGHKKADSDTALVVGVGPHPGKREEKKSAASGGWERGLWQWRTSDLQGSCGDLRQAKASPAPGSGHNSAEERARGDGEETPLLPSQALLCPLLQVPESTRLNCIVENDMCKRRQDMAFNVRGVGGAHLFQVRVAELGSNTPGIFVETLGGEALLAFLSTEEIWHGNSRPTLSIFWPSGVHYGTMRKSEEGEYIVQQNGAVMLVYAGDFANHSVRIKNGAGRTVGTISQDSQEEYQVVVHTLNDAGLVILGALAIDKCEMEAASRPLSSTGTSVSDVGVLFGEQQQRESHGERQSLRPDAAAA